jgi:hypothetical protein
LSRDSSCEGAENGGVWCGGGGCAKGKGRSEEVGVFDGGGRGGKGRENGEKTVSNSSWTVSSITDDLQGMRMDVSRDNDGENDGDGDGRTIRVGKLTASPIENDTPTGNTFRSGHGNGSGSGGGSTTGTSTTANNDKEIWTDWSEGDGEVMMSVIEKVGFLLSYSP